MHCSAKTSVKIVVAIALFIFCACTACTDWLLGSNEVRLESPNLTISQSVNAAIGDLLTPDIEIRTAVGLAIRSDLSVFVVAEGPAESIKSAFDSLRLDDDPLNWEIIRYGWPKDWSRLSVSSLERFGVSEVGYVRAAYSTPNKNRATLYITTNVIPNKNQFGEAFGMQ